LAGYNWKYAYPGPPFHWLGNFSLTQWNALKQWANSRQGDVAAVSTFHRIRAQQLRKTAGVLEQYYSSVYPGETGTYGETLAPTFNKEAWKPGENGHFNFPSGDDQLPMVLVGKVKTRMREMFQRHEDASYYMNQVRCIIEKHEDLAQYTNDFVQTSTPAGTPKSVPSDPTALQDILTKIDSYFSKPEYQSVLVDDTKLYKNQPYFRVHPADPPTIFELEQANHSPSNFPIGIVDRGKIDP